MNNDYITLLLGAVFWQNIVLARLLGLTPYLVERSYSIRRMYHIGLITTMLMIIISPLVWAFNQFILLPLELFYLQTMLFLLLLLCFIFLGDCLLKRFENVNNWSYYYPDIFMNTAIMGLALLHLDYGHTFQEILIYSIGTGLGFMLILVLMEAMQERLEAAKIPFFLEGIPLNLIIISILAFIFSGFEGL